MWPPQELAKKVAEFNYYLGHCQQIFDELEWTTDIQKEQLSRVKDSIDGLSGMFFRIFNGEEYDEKSFEYFIKEYTQDVKHREI